MHNFFQLSLGYMAKRKVRTALTTLAILFGVSVIFGTWTSLPSLRVALEENIARSTTVNTTIQDVERDLLVASTIMNGFGSIALFVGAFLIFNTFRTVVVERQQDLAMLRAVGAERGQIMRLILIEALLQGVIGSLLGLGLGWCFAVWVVQWSYELGVIGESVPPPPILDPGAMLFATSLGIAVTLLAAYLPARRAAAVSPLAALRPTTPEEEQRSVRWNVITGLGCMIPASVMLLLGEKSTAPIFILLGAVLIAPAVLTLSLPLIVPLMRRVFPHATDIAYGNLLRQRGRAAVTLNTLMIGFAIFIACSALVVSMQDFFVRYFTFSFASDYLIVDRANATRLAVGTYDSEQTIDPEMVERLRALPEVQMLTGVRTSTTMYQDTLIRFVGIEPQAAPQLRPLDLDQGEVESVLRALEDGRNLVISPRFAADFGLAVGDTITLETLLEGAQVYTVVGVANDILIGIGNYGATLSQTTLARDYGVQGDFVLYVKMQPDANADALRAVMDRGMLLIDVIAFRQEGVDAGTAAMGFYYVLAVMVIFPSLLGLINTLTISVLERTREFGMLRAIGGERGHVQRIVLVETLLLSVLGVLIGVGVGLALSLSLIAMWETRAGATVGGLHLVFPFSSIVSAVIVGTGVVLLTSLTPARRAARLNIVDALRYE